MSTVSEGHRGLGHSRAALRVDVNGAVELVFAIESGSRSTHTKQFSCFLRWELTPLNSCGLSPPKASSLSVHLENIK